MGESQRTCKVTPVYRRNWPQIGGVGAGLGAETLFYSAGKMRLYRDRGLGGRLGFTHLVLTRLSSEDTAVQLNTEARTSGRCYRSNRYYRLVTASY